MPSIYDIKPAFQRVLKPLLKLLVAWGLTPNQITLAALFLSFAGGAAVFASVLDPLWLWVLPGVLFVRMALNALDGMMARQYQMSTPLGEILNELGDVVADFVLYLPLSVQMLYSLEALSLWLGFLVIAILTEFCGVLGKAMVSIRCYDGPMGKSDRAFAVGLLAILLYFSLLPPTGVVIFIAILDLLLILTCVNRLRRILQAASPQAAS